MCEKTTKIPITKKIKGRNQSANVFNFRGGFRRIKSPYLSVKKLYISLSSFPSFILFLFYMSYILTWKFIDNFEKANKISSIIGIVGLFNLPVIKYSVDWWNTLHQPSSITLTSAPTIHYTMLVPLIIMFFGMLIYSLIIFLIKYRTEIMRYKLDKKKR